MVFSTVPRSARYLLVEQAGHDKMHDLRFPGGQAFEPPHHARLLLFRLTPGACALARHVYGRQQRFRSTASSGSRRTAFIAHTCRISPCPSENDGLASASRCERLLHAKPVGVPACLDPDDAIGRVEILGCPGTRRRPGTPPPVTRSRSSLSETAARIVVVQQQYFSGVFPHKTPLG